VLSLIIGCWIVDKTNKYDAAVHSGTKPALWVKYRLSIFHNNYNNKYYIAWMINKAENLVILRIIKIMTKKKS